MRLSEANGALSEKSAQNGQLLEHIDAMRSQLEISQMRIGQVKDLFFKFIDNIEIIFREYPIDEFW